MRAVALKKDDDGTYHGDVFIIPNGLSSYESMKKYNDGKDRSDVQFTCEENGVKCTDETKFVQIWATSPECDNWNCHYGAPEEFVENRELHGYFRHMRGTCWFPDILPVDIFAGKKEGDTVIVSLSGIKCSLTLAQTKHRYESFGNFEVCLQNLN